MPGFPGDTDDTNAEKLRLPGEKLNRLCHPNREWLQKKRCTKRELLSIVGQLQVNCNMQHHIKLNAGARSELAWWHEFLEDWNGLSLLAALGELKPTVVLTSDASGSWGCGAFWNTKWLQLAWSDTACLPKTNIATRELIPIVITAAMWGRFWEGQVNSCRCDNEAVVAVVAVLTSHTSRDSDLMHLL